MNSILQPWSFGGRIPHDAECYLCHGMADERHHIFHGPNRQMSEEDGCWVYLCHTCHMGLHQKPTHVTADGIEITTDLWLKRICQAQLMHERQMTAEGFRARYGRSYL